MPRAKVLKLIFTAVRMWSGWWSDDGCLLRPFVDDLEEDLGAEVRDGNIADLIDGDQVLAIPASQYPNARYLWAFGVYLTRSMIIHEQLSRRRLIATAPINQSNNLLEGSSLRCRKGIERTGFRLCFEPACHLSGKLLHLLGNTCLD